MYDYESLWLSALTSHKEQIHQNFRCTQCIFVSASESDMVFHWRLQHDTKRSNLKTIPVVPPSVGFKVQNEDRKRTSYECIMCTFKTYSKESLSQHIIKEHRDMLEEEMEAQNNDNIGPQLAKIDSEDEEVGYYKCNMCDYETVWMSHWSEHKKQSHQNFLCDKCNYKSTSEAPLVNHWKLKHSNQNETKAHNENNDSKADTGNVEDDQSSESISRSMKSQSKGLPMCPYPNCGKRLPNLWGLKKHYADEHNVVSEKYPCPHCNKTLKTPGFLKYHIECHHNGPKSYPCSECPLTFDAGHRRRYHMNTVHFPGKFVCSFCKMSFAGTRQSLLMFMLYL